MQLCYTVYMYIISLIGAPCSGKGTSARALQHEQHFHAIGAGDTLREYMKETGDEFITNLVNNGRIVPVEIVWKLMRHKIEKILSHSQTQHTRILLDGFPRDQNQAEYLCEFLKHYPHAKVFFIELEVSDSILLDRMMIRYICDNTSCNYISNNPNTQSHQLCTTCSTGKMYRRKDDNAEIFEERLRVYHTNLKPLKEYLISQKQKWVTINAECTVEQMKTDLYNVCELT